MEKPSENHTTAELEEMQFRRQARTKAQKDELYLRYAIENEEEKLDKQKQMLRKKTRQGMLKAEKGEGGKGRKRSADEDGAGDKKVKKERM